jgi:thiol-disulfide isomerase/thioredoxin
MAEVQFIMNRNAIFKYPNIIVMLELPIKTIFISLMMVCSFANAQKSFSLKGHFKKKFEGKVILEYGDRLDTAEVLEGGYFSFTGDIGFPIEATLSIETPLQIQKHTFIIDPLPLTMTVDTVVLKELGKEYISILPEILDGPTTNNLKALEKNIISKVLAVNDKNEQRQIFLTEITAHMKQKPTDPAGLIAVYKTLSEFSLLQLRTIYEGLSETAKRSTFAKKILDRLQKDEMATVGKKIDHFEQTDANGKNITIESLKGKYVLIDFWASWCGPCRIENPKLKVIYNKYKGKGFEILAVSLDIVKENWINAIQKDGLPWLHVSDLKGWSNAVSRLFKISVVPDNILVDDKGLIVAKGVQSAELDSLLNKAL